MSLQVELDNSEAVQRDFVKLSQSLQVGQRSSSHSHCRWFRCQGLIVTTGGSNVKVSQSLQVGQRSRSNSHYRWVKGQTLTVKAVSDDTIFACDCSRLHQTRFESCRMRGTIVSCETNLRRNRGQSREKIALCEGVSHDTFFSPDSITQNRCLVPFKFDQQILALNL